MILVTLSRSIIIIIISSSSTTHWQGPIAEHSREQIILSRSRGDFVFSWRRTDQDGVNKLEDDRGSHFMLMSDAPNRLSKRNLCCTWLFPLQSNAMHHPVLERITKGRNSPWKVFDCSYFAISLLSRLSNGRAVDEVLLHIVPLYLADLTPV